MCTPFEDGTIQRIDDNLGERGIARSKWLIVVRSGDYATSAIGFERFRRGVDSPLTIVPSRS